jgi:hypothetical protein
MASASDRREAAATPSRDSTSSVSSPLPPSSSPLVVVVHRRVLSSSAALPPQDHRHSFCLAVEGSSASRSPLLCPGWLSRRILSLHLRLCLSFLRRTASFFCPLAVQPLPLIVSRRRWLSRRCRLLSAGATPPICLSYLGWLSRRIPLGLLPNPPAFEAPLPLVC